MHTTSVTKRRSVEGLKMVNQYTIIKQIGCGAFGKVFKVRNGNGEIVAAKVYNKRVLKSRWIGKKRTALDLVKTEIEISSLLYHNNITRLIEVIDAEDCKKIYLIMEYAENGDIHEKCPFSEEESRKYFKELIKALNYMHNVIHVVHRDIKPKNLLLSSQNTLKVCDFGSAQFIDANRGELNNSAGTYIFMPPEAHKEGPYKGKPADVWACGITLYYMVAGKSPFSSRKLSDFYDPPKEFQIEFPDNFSEELKDLIKEMTATDPSFRISVKKIKRHPWITASKKLEQVIEVFSPSQLIEG